MSADVTPLPSAKDVRECIEGLVGRDVDVTTGGAMVDPEAEGGAVVAVYVDRLLQLRAVVLMDLPLAASCGAAIGLVPASAVGAAVGDGLLPENLLENAGEVLNVLASLFNAEGAPHVRLDQVYAPGRALPSDVSRWVKAYVRRTDLTMSVRGYAEGAFSLLVP